MKKIFACAALVTALTGCDTLVQRDAAAEDGLEAWRARSILGGGDGQTARRAEGRVTSGRLVEAGQGTIYPGRQPLFRADDPASPQGARTVSLNLVDVTIADAAAAILGELFKINYVLDPAVSGRVNIRSTEPVTRTTAVEVFELALKQNGAALVRQGGGYAIVPLTADMAVRASISRDVPLGYSIRVVPLRHIGSPEMATILQPFAGDGIVGIDAQRNILVLAGTSGDQRAWQDVIQSFDVNWLANKSVGIFPIRGRSAQSIISGLDLIVDKQEGQTPLVAFEVIPENNSILAVARTPSALQNVQTWIQRLTTESANDAQVYSYDMKYARASDIAPTLASILGIQAETEGEAADPMVPAELADQVTVVGGGADVNATRIVASEQTNTLLIHATNAEYQRILGMLHRLDVPPRQVLVEATIVEVSLNDQLRYGTQYFLNQGNNSVGLSRGNAVSIAPEVPGLSAIFDVANPEIIIDALDSVTEVNVVSSPNLMILNNQSARLAVGDQVPISVRTATDAVENAEVFVSTVEFRETGVIFEVTPRINSSGAVILDIDQEVSTVAGTDASTGNPIISQRNVSSSVAVESGETIALGGLFEGRKTRGSSGVPVLSRTPVIGGLFGRQNRRDQQTELLVLITPRIVNSTTDARRVTSSLRDRMERIRLDDATLSTTIGRSPSPDQGASLAPVARPGAVQGDPVVVSSRGQAGTHLVYLGAFGVAGNAQAHRDRIAVDPAVAGLTPRLLPAGDLTAVVIGPVAEWEASRLCAAVTSDCVSRSIE